MHDIFLSYSREDRAIAQRVVAALERGGYSVWWDGLLEGGERFSDVTEAALDNAQVVVVLWSKTSVKSHWVHDEATRGRNRERLVPASIDGTPPPLGFGQFQALDLSKWKGKDDAPEIADLRRAVAIAIGKPAQAPKQPPTRPRVSRRVVLGGAAAATAAAAAAGGIGAWKAGWFASDATRNSVAVLPLRNLSDDKSQQFFAEGISDEIRGTLARNPLLKVIATTSSNLFRDRAEGFPAIAAKLAVGHVLDGSVRSDGNTVRIALQLIEAATGRAIWSETFDRAYARIFEIQSETAQKVMRVLNVNLGGGGFTAEDNRRSTGGTDNTAAFAAFLEAKNMIDRRDPNLSDEEIDKVLARPYEIDPNYAAAYALHADIMLRSANEGMPKPLYDKFVGSGEALALKARALAPDAPVVLNVLSMLAVLKFEFGKAIAQRIQAFAKAPTTAPCRRAISKPWRGGATIRNCDGLAICWSNTIRSARRPGQPRRKATCSPATRKRRWPPWSACAN